MLGTWFLVLGPLAGRRMYELLSPAGAAVTFGVSTAGILLLGVVALDRLLPVGPRPPGT